MQAVDVMHRDPVTVLPTDTVDHAARAMLEHQISGLPVVDRNRKLVGIVTEGDLLHRVENDTDRVRSPLSQTFTPSTQLRAEFVKATGRQVKDVMAPNVVTVSESALLAEVADLFDRHPSSVCRWCAMGSWSVSSAALICCALWSVPAAPEPATSPSSIFLNRFPSAG